MQQPGGGPAWGAMTHAVQEKRSNVNTLHTKAFTAWINHTLRGQAVIGDCTKELGTGLVLVRLVEHFTGSKCPFPYKAAATNRTLCIDNVSVALKFLSQHVPNLAIAPADIVDGNTQVILGLLWRLILKWQNSLQVQRTQGEVGEQAASESVVKTTKDAKAKLLEWIRSKVGSYPHVKISNDFVESFDSGMALCALVHAYDPSLVAFDMLDPNRKLDNLALGMQLAEQFMGVPRMLDPGDVANADDKAMMVYLYEFPKAFLARMEHASGELGDEAANRRAAEEEEERRRREAAAAAAAAGDAARRQAELAEEEEAARRRAEEERRRMEEEARRRFEDNARREDEARRRAAEESERQRQAAELERMRMFQQSGQGMQSPYPPAGGGGQYPQYPVAVAAPPPGGVAIQTVVIREESSIGRLTVEVVNCRNLKSQDLLTNSATPYCVVQVERQKERTRKEKHTLSPNFHERFQFYVSELYATVDVCVYDHNVLLSDYFMGKVEIPVKSLAYDVIQEGWHVLQPLHQSGKAVGGEIYLRLTLRKG